MRASAPAKLCSLPESVSENGEATTSPKGIAQDLKGSSLASNDQSPGEDPRTNGTNMNGLFFLYIIIFNDHKMLLSKESVQL